MSPGKTSDWQEKYSKKIAKIRIHAKLNEKNLPALKKAAKVFGELGIRPPSTMQANEETAVKATMYELKILNNTCKIS